MQSNITPPYCMQPPVDRIYMVLRNDKEVSEFKERLITVFTKIFKENNSIPIGLPDGHHYKDNIPLLLKIVGHLVNGIYTNLQNFETLFDEPATKNFLFDIANAIELDQWHDFISETYSKRIHHCKKEGLVDCMKHNKSSTNNKDKYMNELELSGKYNQNIRRSDDIDVSNNDPAKSFSDAQYTIIDTMPSYLKKIVDTNLIELKTTAYYIDSAPCKGGTSPLLYNFNTYGLNTHSEFFIVNCALAFYQSFFKSLKNFVFTINGMGDTTVSNNSYILLESIDKRYTINIKYYDNNGQKESEYTYTAIGGQKGHFTVANIVKTLVCENTPKNSPSYVEIIKLIEWLKTLPGLSHNAKKNFIVSFLTLNKGFGDFVQMFMCLYLFYIEITIDSKVCAFLYNIILATCDSHLTYIALICECPFIIGGCEPSRKIYIDGKNRYLDKTFDVVWNRYNKIQINSTPTGTVELPVFKWIPVINCVCNGKGKASNNTSVSSIFNFESINKSYLKLELDTLHRKSKLIFQKEEGNLIIELTIGDYQIKLLNGEVHTPYTVPYVFNIIFKEDNNLEFNKLFTEKISDSTIDFNKNLYKYLSTNVDVIITSILYNNFLYNMFIGNKSALDNIKISLANAKDIDYTLFIPFTLKNFRIKKKTSYAHYPVERFIAWGIALNRSYGATGNWGSGENRRYYSDFYDYVIRTAECLKVLFSYYVAIDEYIFKLNNFANREQNAKTLNFDLINFTIVGLIDFNGENHPLPYVLIKIFNDYKVTIINEMREICNSYYRNINIYLFFYYLPAQINELIEIMKALNSDTYKSHQDTVRHNDACSVAIKCFKNIIESHQKIISYQQFIDGNDAVTSSLVNSEDACVLEGDDADDIDGIDGIDGIDSNEPANIANIANINQILQEAIKLYPNQEALVRIKGHIASIDFINSQRDRPKRGKRKNEDDEDVEDNEEGPSNKKPKMVGGYTVSEYDTSLLSFNIQDKTQLSFLVNMDEHYIQLNQVQKPPCILKIALNFSLSELIYSIKEQSIYDEENEDSLYIMITAMYKLLAFTEFILYKSNDSQPNSIDIITLTNIRIYIEKILNEYNTTSLTISSEDIEIAQSSLFKLNELLLNMESFFTTLITFISNRCELPAEHFDSITLTLDNKYNMDTRECIIVVYINDTRLFEITNNANNAYANNILIFCLGYEIIKYTREKVAVGIAFIQDKFGRMQGGIFKNNKVKQTIHYKKIQKVRKNITGYVSKNVISRSISMPKPSKQPEKSPKPSKQPEKSPKPSKQPEKLPKPSKQPEQIKVTDNNNQNISKYKLRVEQFKNKKFSAYFEKKLKTYLNDKNINIYKIGIMKMRGILKNIYKLD